MISVQTKHIYSTLGFLAEDLANVKSAISGVSMPEPLRWDQKMAEQCGACTSLTGFLCSEVAVTRIREGGFEVLPELMQSSDQD